MKLLMFLVRLPRRVTLPLAVVAIVGGGYLGYDRVLASRNGEVEQIQTVAVSRDTIVAMVNASGPVRPLRAADISFRSGGWVKEVFVTVGDKVTKGQPLANLETADLELNIKRAEANLSIAKARLATIQKGARPEELDSARAALDSAEARLDAMKIGSRAEDVVAAESNLMSTNAKLDELIDGPKADEIASAQAAVDTARARVKSAQAKLDELLNPTAVDLAEAQAGVDSTKATLTSARAKLEQMKNPHPDDLTAAQATVNRARASLSSAQAKLDDLVAGPTAAELTTAEATVQAAKTRLANAKSAMERLKVDLNDEKINNIIQARLRLRNARDQLERDEAGDASAEQIAADEDEIIRALRAVQTAEEDLDWPKLGVSASDLVAAQGDIDDANASLRSAQAKLDELTADPKPQDLQAAQAEVEQNRSSLASAQANLERLRTPTTADVQAAQSSIDRAKADLSSAETRLEQMRNPSNADLSSAQEAVDSAEASLRSAQAKLDQVLDGPTAAELTSAVSSVAQAEAQLALKLRPYTQQDIQQQVNAVIQADRQLALKKAPYTEEDILTAQAQVDQADAALSEAHFNLRDATLVAPFDGVVSAVNITPSRSTGSGSGSVAVAVSILDPSVYKVDLSVDESEVAKVELEQPAIITFDALTERRYRGKIIAIAPQATTESGVTSYLVSLSIENPQGIKAGMTGLAEIISARKADVLVVPARAVRRQGRAQMVQVMVNGKPENREVTTGINDGSRLEVIDGLKEGDQVVVTGIQSISGGLSSGIQRRALGGGGIPSGGSGSGRR